MEQEFRLFYQANELGRIQLLGKESNSAFGKIKLSLDLKEDHVKIHEYIEYCYQADKLLEKEEALYLAFIEKEEGKFIDLIESSNWKLMDSSGALHEILIPVFYGDKEVVWRWRY